MSKDKIIFKAPHSGIYRVDNGKVNLEVRVAADCQECFNLAHDLLKQREENEKLKAQLEKAEEALLFYSIIENWEMSAIDDLCTVRTKLTKDKESFGDVDAPGLASKLVIYGGQRARKYFKEKEQV